MYKHRLKAKVDVNQQEIVNQLRKLGYSVQVGMDDILVGAKDGKKNYWFEIKAPDTVSKKTGKVLESSIKPSQKKLMSEWRGQYDLVTSLCQILEIMK